jgi:hypothetical protein
MAKAEKITEGWENWQRTLFIKMMDAELDRLVQSSEYAQRDGFTKAHADYERLIQQFRNLRNRVELEVVE